MVFFFYLVTHALKHKPSYLLCEHSGLRDNADVRLVIIVYHQTKETGKTQRGRFCKQTDQYITPGYLRTPQVRLSLQMLRSFTREKHLLHRDMFPPLSTLHVVPSSRTGVNKPGPRCMPAVSHTHTVTHRSFDALWLLLGSCS